MLHLFIHRVFTVRSGRCSGSWNPRQISPIKGILTLNTATTETIIYTLNPLPSHQIRSKSMVVRQSSRVITVTGPTLCDVKLFSSLCWSWCQITNADCGDHKFESGSTSCGGQICGKSCRDLQADQWGFSVKVNVNRCLLVTASDFDERKCLIFATPLEKIMVQNDALHLILSWHP